ncbi:MAG TPA: cation:proton antiporter [Chthoniobacterales bacterium]
MTFDIAYFVIGSLLVAVAMVASLVKRLPLTETMIYLIAGAVLGPLGLGLFSLDVLTSAVLLERLAEIAVIVSLFTAGLKLRLPLRDVQWRIPLRLAFVSMVLTVGLVTLVGVAWLGLPLGAAVLLGAVIAPTDPVLASGVQIENVRDRDRLRFSLTGEAGFNDGTAFPFVMLGLGLLGLRDLGIAGWKWWTLDVAWAVGAGLAIGAAFGTLVARLVLWLRREHKEAVGRDEFLALGLIALAYGAALVVHAYGFLAVFAAGVALRAVERTHSSDRVSEEVLAMEAAGDKYELATDPEKAPAHMAGAVLAFNEQMERIMEIALVLLIGGAFSSEYVRFEELGFIAVLFLLIRPLAVHAGLLGARKMGATERGFISWFGIRGIGSLYYLTFAVNRGLSAELAWRLTTLTLTTIAVSIIAHGITVTPLMNWYQKRRRR